MTPKIAVHVDHIRGLVAIEWPDRASIDVYDAEGPTRLHGVGQHPHTVPGGMTRMVDEEVALDAVRATAQAAAEVAARRRGQSTTTRSACATTAKGA
jgi:hypothetical protein